jgi:PPK2 family polyphosphate:nucleotide phosphotransferase
MAEPGLKRLRQLTALLHIKPGRAVSLPKDFDPGFTADFGKDDAEKAQGLLQQGIALLTEYQDRLAAQDTHALLVVLQGLDAAGKDSTIKHVMSGVNPQWVDVHPFKVPSDEELNHDYLWRYEQKLPRRGMIGIFNRSHYEEVLVVRVHPDLLDTQHLPPEHRNPGIWKQRFKAINAWEQYLVENGIHVVKLFLNLSRDEQLRRFLARIDKPEKNWKFTAADVRERAHWDEYQKAYAEALSHTSTEWAPWYVIPADHKWFERIAAAAVIVDALVRINPQYPAATPKQIRELELARRDLLAEVQTAKPTKRKT